MPITDDLIRRAAERLKAATPRNPVYSPREAVAKLRPIIEMKRSEGLSFDEIHELLADVFGKNDFLKKSTFLKYYRECAEKPDAVRTPNSRAHKADGPRDLVRADRRTSETDAGPRTKQDAPVTAEDVDHRDEIPKARESHHEPHDPGTTCEGSPVTDVTEGAAGVLHAKDAPPQESDLRPEASDVGTETGTASECKGDGYSSQGAVSANSTSATSNTSEKTPRSFPAAGAGKPATDNLRVKE